MRAFLRYFRQHPWQRRTLTLLLACILGVLGAWAAWPTVRDRQTLALLGSSDPLDRERGIRWARHVAPTRPALVRLLERHLADENDSRFAAIAEVLTRVGRFDDRSRTGEQLDRYAVINLAAGKARPAGLRLRWLHQLTLTGRDNPHVRRALKLTGRDEAPLVRRAAAVLAARLGDDPALLRLLEDGEPQVRAAAALDAALAARSECVHAIAEMALKARTDEELAAAVFALRVGRLGSDPALLPKRQQVLRRAVTLAKQPGRENLLGMLLSDAPRLELPSLVLGAFEDAAKKKAVPPAMAFVAAGKMKIDQARPVITAAINDMIARRQELTVGEAVTLAAAVNAARRLKMPPALFVKAMEKLWHPGTSLAMLLAAEGLGESAAGEDAKVLALLRAAAEDTRTPLPAAAAAVALFQLAPDQAAEALRTVCESETYLAGDYVAWHLARSGKPQARRVAEEFFAPRVYNKAVRSTGALLLAMLSRGTDQAAPAERAIEARLRGGPLGGERDPFVAGAYRCGLMMLGRREFADYILDLQASDTFPKRRTLTALLLGGHAGGFDRVLARRRFDPAAMDAYLTGRLMARVYPAVAPELPAVDVEAPAAVRYWQCRVLRDHYLIHRRAILDRMGS